MASVLGAATCRFCGLDCDVWLEEDDSGRLSLDPDDETAREGLCPSCGGPLASLRVREPNA